MNRLSALILAGGEGKRMKSDKPKKNINIWIKKNAHLSRG